MGELRTVQAESDLSLAPDDENMGNDLRIEQAENDPSLALDEENMDTIPIRRRGFRRKWRKLKRWFRKKFRKVKRKIRSKASCKKRCVLKSMLQRNRASYLKHCIDRS